MKPIDLLLHSIQLFDAPHTGARLETVPPPKTEELFGKDAPHTGARLETGNPFFFSSKPSGCPPHGGTT